MRRYFLFALSLTSCFLLVTCGGNMSTTGMIGGNAVRTTISITDTPPNGVAVLFFEALITGASLQPSDITKPAVSVLAQPVEVEFGHLQTNTAFLSLANIAPDTYNNLTLTFGSAILTIINHSGAAIGSCANNAVCEMSPSSNPTTATVSSSPFPITIAQNSVVGIRLDFNLNSSVQTDLSISPLVTVKHLTLRQEDEDNMEMEQVDEVDGEVNAVSTNQFTLLNERSGQSFTVIVDSNTVFEDFGQSGCNANPADFSCIAAGQILNVELSENGMGSMLAKRVEFEETANKVAIKGTITSMNSATQFAMVVFNEEPAANGISEGAPVTVTIQQGATFQVGGEELDEDGGFSLSGLSFASGADLMVGQDVQIRPGTVTTSGGVTTISTNLVRLWPSQITGQVKGMSDGSFTLTNLSPLFTGATPPVNLINVVTLSDMNFEDSSGGSSLTPGNTISVKGLLFNTPTTPTLVTRTLRNHQD